MNKDKLQAQIEAVNELEDKYKDFYEKYLITRYYCEIETRAIRGCADAQFIAFQMGSGKAHYKKYSNAFDFCQSSAKQGNALAQYFLGDSYFKRGEFKEAFKWYKKSAKQNNVLAQIKVAECYYDGKGVEKSWNRATEWMSRASKPKLDLPQNTLENDNTILMLENRDLIETVKGLQTTVKGLQTTVKGLLKDKRELIENNTKLINDIEQPKKEQPKKEQSKKEQSKLKNWFKKLKGKTQNDKSKNFIK